MGGSEVSVIEFPSDSASISAARRWITERLGGVPPEVRSDVVLAASELVTNAVRHGGGGEVRVMVDVAGEAVALSVTSRPGRSEVPDVASWGPADPTAASGRGLGIVRAVSDRVELARTDDEVSVRLERRLGAAHGT